MQSFDHEIQSVMYPENKATDENRCDNCKEYKYKIIAATLFI